MNKQRFKAFFLFACLCLLAIPNGLAAQTATSAQSLTPGPKPLDGPAEWKELIGFYQTKPMFDSSGKALILEREQKLYWQTLWDLFSTMPPALEIHISGENPPTFSLQAKGDPELALSFQRNPKGAISGLKVGNALYERTDAGSDPSRFYHVTPPRPVEELRKAALAAKPPEEPGPFRQPDLVELSPFDPAIHLDIRYAQSNNFLSTPVYTQARAFLQHPAADALLRVQQKLKPLGYGLLIHDAYRPWYVTKIFWDATPPEGKIFVADPAQGSRHNRGCAVDLTLYELATGKPVEMPGTYDEMSPRSYPGYPGGTSLQRWHRDLLRRAMESEGFTVYEAEWWHFDYKDWKEYPILNVPFEKLALRISAGTAH